MIPLKRKKENSINPLVDIKSSLYDYDVNSPSKDKLLPNVSIFDTRKTYSGNNKIIRSMTSLDHDTTLIDLPIHIHNDSLNNSNVDNQDADIKLLMDKVFIELMIDSKLSSIPFIPHSPYLHIVSSNSFHFCVKLPANIYDLDLELNGQDNVKFVIDIKEVHEIILNWHFRKGDEIFSYYNLLILMGPEFNANHEFNIKYSIKRFSIILKLRKSEESLLIEKITNVYKIYKKINIGNNDANHLRLTSSPQNSNDIHETQYILTHETTFNSLEITPSQFYSTRPKDIEDLYSSLTNEKNGLLFGDSIPSLKHNPIPETTPVFSKNGEMERKLRLHSKILTYHGVPSFASENPLDTKKCDSIEITSSDILCLKDNEFLNDSIIDFYLKYLWCERIKPPNLQAKIHIFSSFFYNRLTSRLPDIKSEMDRKEKGNRLNRNEDVETLIDDSKSTTDLIISKDEIKEIAQSPSPTSYNGNSNKICDEKEENSKSQSEPFQRLRIIYDRFLSKYCETLSHVSPGSVLPNITKVTTISHLADKDAIDPLGPYIHGPVKKWTKNIDIFRKEYIVIPINKDSHWFLAIICLPPNLRDSIENSYHYSRDKKLQNCTNPPFRTIYVLIFDSLLKQRHRALSRYIRAYLNEEWNSKKFTSTLTTPDSNNVEFQRYKNFKIIFNESNLVCVYPKIAQQDNYHDCGLYLLKYFETFFSHLPDWSEKTEPLKRQFYKGGWKIYPDVIKGKRKEIRDLILCLSKGKNKI
ncbi:unnamed protein product [Gordionus sp. m RMFG-2023]|uniref:uncharacterized protein LOC135930905 n=1 Tax=Gordionus sp. m RMFG-2023 TaxID=3053472 RepID=UPI0030E097B7